MAETGAWIIENCSSKGFDDLTLTGAVSDFTTFSSAIPVGDVWYAIKDANGNREEGIGYFDSLSLLGHLMVMMIGKHRRLCQQVKTCMYGTRQIYNGRY